MSTDELMSNSAITMVILNPSPFAPGISIAKKSSLNREDIEDYFFDGMHNDSVAKFTLRAV